MPLPLRFVVTTYNIWTNSRWPLREPALRSYIQGARPDILCVQELTPDTRAVLDEVLPDHQRVDDPFEGWIKEGNIFWSNRLFELVEYGAESIGMVEPLRRLFWARLRIREHGRTMLVSTAHYTFQAHKQEVATGTSPRNEQARQTVTALHRLAHRDEPTLFMGDLNDMINPIRILRDEGGLKTSYDGRGITPRTTHPTIPTALHGVPQVLDWQFHRGPLRVMACEVVDYFLEDHAPSDHKPVAVTYALEDL